MAVKDFEARLIEVLRDGGTRSLTFRFSKLDEAHSFRQRLYRLRTMMNKEKDSPAAGYTLESWGIAVNCANRCDLKLRMYPKHGEPIKFVNKKITPPPNPDDLMPFNPKQGVSPFALVIEPKDLSFEDVLQQSGYAIEDLKL